MCGFIILFASVLSLADASGFSEILQSAAYWLTANIWPSDFFKDALSSIFPCLIEVSCGSVEAARTGAAAPLLLGMALSWGGLSVHCQIASVVQGYKLIGKSFFASRILHSLLGGLFSVLLFRSVPIATVAYKPLSDTKIIPFYSNAAASVALLILCALFLVTFVKREDEVLTKKRTGKKEADML
jgi:hypothetical protein